MKRILYWIVAIAIFLVILLVTFLPKLISIMWYGKISLIEEPDYFGSIVDLTLSITGDLD